MADVSALSIVPTPPGLSEAERERIDHTRLRRDLLYGRTREHVRRRIELNIGSVREEAWGEPDLSGEPFLDLCTGGAHLYDNEPTVRTPSDSSTLADDVANAGLWALMQRVQRDTVGLREMLVAVDVEGIEDPLASGIPFSFRPVFPDMVQVTGHPRHPSVPVRVREYRTHPVYGWLRYDMSVENPDAPFYRVWTADEALLVTEEVLGGPLDGAGYPYRDSNGRPILRYGMYHAAETGLVFDAFTLRGVVEGSLNVGVLLTYYGHLIRNAAWAQRYAVNLEPVGMDVEDTDTPFGRPALRREVVTDPSTLMCLRLIDAGIQPIVGQWQSPADPEAVLRSIGMYERRMLMSAGLAPADVTRQTADIRSGYSLAVDREAARERQAVFRPQFERGDRNLLRIAACLSNRFRETNYSENPADYRPVYTSLPKSPAEIRVAAEVRKARVDAGELGPVEALREAEPELTDAEAIDRLADVAAQKARVEAATKAKLAELGIEQAPPVVELSAPDKATARQVVADAAAGTIDPETAKALLVHVVGLSEAQAAAITATIKPKSAGEMAA
jgi:hypothetical protein